MAVWTALFRGINVGGANRLPMAELRAELEALGFEGVATVVQSGNVVFRSGARSGAKLGERIADAVEASHGFRAKVLVLPARDVERALERVPFPGVADPKALHVWFCFETPRKPDLDALAELATPSEEFHLDGKLFYLHAPDGIGRSKLAAQVDRHLGVLTTARNLRTMRKLVELAREVGS